MANIGNKIVDQDDIKIKLSGNYELTTYYEDTDLSGYVYHANYLKYFERARSSLLSVEIVKSLLEAGLHFVVSNAQLKYRRPCLYGEKLTIHTSLEFGRSPRTTVYQRVYKQGNEKPIVLGEIELVLVNKEGRPREIPPMLFDLIKSTTQSTVKA